MPDDAHHAAWGGFERSAPELAATVRATLGAHPHHVIATLAPDGAPRVGGTNVYITDGEMWIGMMPQALRIDDLRRDPRCALHSAPLDEHLHRPDVRLNLFAHEMDAPRFTELLQSIGHPDPTSGGVGFSLSLRRVTVLTVEGERLAIEAWTPRRGAWRTLTP